MNHVVSVHAPFSKNSIFHEKQFRKSSKCRSVFASFFLDFPYFFGLNFCIDFFIDFWWKMVPNMDQNLLAVTSLFPSFSRPSPKVDFLMHFGRPLAHLWLPFGSPCLPFGSIGDTFGSLWLPFGSLLVPFGSLLVPLGPLLLTLARDFLTFGVSWRHFWYFLEFSMEIICKIFFFRKCSLKFRLLLFFQFLRHFQQSTRRQYQGPWPSHTTVFKGPERNLAAGNLDPHRASGT